MLGAVSIQKNLFPITLPSQNENSFPVILWFPLKKILTTLSIAEQKHLYGAEQRLTQGTFPEAGSP